MYMDMDLTADSAPVSRAPTPPPEINGSAVVEEEEQGEEPPAKKGGNLMKEIKQDVQQGAAEFNMDSFF